MTKLILAAFAAAALFAVTSSANAGRGGCDDWGCGSNGTQVTGIALGSASTGAVNAVILSSGEIVNLR